MMVLTNDVEAIVDTDDIAPEQKMAARLERAKWRIKENSPAAARIDLDVVLASHRHFAPVDAEARGLLAELPG